MANFRLLPVCYWVWQENGWLYKAGVIDFAGGIVVHATAGASALTLAWMLGRRNGFPKSLKPPTTPGMVMIGASMLWVGWFGFNAGSASRKHERRNGHARHPSFGCHREFGLDVHRVEENRQTRSCWYRDWNHRRPCYNYACIRQCWSFRSHHHRSMCWYCLLLRLRFRKG